MNLYTMIYSSRTGPKVFMVTAPIASLMMLSMQPLILVVGAILFGGAISSRLNDIGRSRGHAVWITMWALLIAAMAYDVTHHRVPHSQLAALGLLELPLFILLVALGCWPGQKEANAFGPPPNSFVEIYHRIGSILSRSSPRRSRARKAYGTAYARLRPEMEEIIKANAEGQARINELLEALKNARSMGLTPDMTAGIKREFDIAIAESQKRQERFDFLTEQLKPARDALMRNLV